jgi:hypothetical protein
MTRYLPASSLWIISAGTYFRHDFTIHASPVLGLCCCQRGSRNRDQKIDLSSAQACHDDSIDIRRRGRFKNNGLFGWRKWTRFGPSIFKPACCAWTVGFLVDLRFLVRSTYRSKRMFARVFVFSLARKHLSLQYNLTTPNNLDAISKKGERS